MALAGPPTTRHLSAHPLIARSRGSSPGKTLDLDPGFGIGCWNLGLSYQQKGMHDLAIESFRRAISLSPFKTTMTATLGHALARAGDQAAARTIVTQLERDGGERYVSPLDLALVHTGLGEHDLAFRCLDLARAEHSSRLIFLGVEPMFDSLRPDPRFIALLQDLGLEAGAQASASAKSANPAQDEWGVADGGDDTIVDARCGHGPLSRGGLE